MAKQKIDSMALMEETVKTARAVGVRETVEYLRSLRQVESSALLKNKREIIINEVLVEFNTTLNKLKGKSVGLRYPRMFCFVLLKRHLYMDGMEIGHLFDRSRSRVYEEQKIFSNFSPKFSVEEEMMQRFNKVECRILEKIS